MKQRIFSFVVAMVMMIGIVVPSYADKTLASNIENKDAFNLIEYVDNNKVHSISELENIIAINSNDERVLKSLNNDFSSRLAQNNEKVDDFKIEIDRKNNNIIVTEVKSKENKNMCNMQRKIYYTKRAYAKKNVYSSAGFKIFTVKTKGEFEYDRESYCKINEAEGYFNSSFLSIWDSNCWVDDRELGNRAYVKTYGTANLKVSVAQILGINLTFQTADYSLKLYCNKYGTISTYWDIDFN